MSIEPRPEAARPPSARLPGLLAAGRWRRLAVLVALGFIQAGAAAAIAWILKTAFDRLAGAGRGDIQILLSVVALLIAAGAAAWSRSAERVSAERLGQDYVHDIRRALSRRLLNASLRAIDRRSGGSILLRFVGDLSAMRRWVSLGLARLVVAGTATVGALAALIFVNPLVGIGVAAVLACGAGVVLVHGPVMRSAAREARRRRSRLAGNIGEKVAALAAVQAFGADTRERRRLANQSGKLRDSMVDRARVLGRVDGVAEATGGVALAVAVLVGTYEVAAGAATAGTIAAAMVILGFIIPALRELGRVEQYRHDERVARDKIVEFLEIPAVQEERLPPLTLERGHLELRDVSIRGSLVDMSAMVEPGARVAVVGSNGAGKSTLLAAIAGLIQPDAGHILIDGHPVSDVDIDSVRRAIGIVSADLPLMRGTVEENVRYRWPEAPDEEVARLWRQCHLDEVVRRLPDGRRTRIKRLGVGLSAGQRLRIALARALLGGPAILLLDEAEANLDPRSAQIVERTVTEHHGTVIFATHRIAMARAADVIWHLADGSLVAAGPPAQLLAAGAVTTALLERDADSAA